jgi:predicted O-methyltransferase YrrM
MLNERERSEIDRLWARKLTQDTQGIPQAERHRNLEPPSAELLHTLASGVNAGLMVEIGGSSGISTIALAAAARATRGRVVSFEIEPVRQAEARETLQRLALDGYVEFICGDAAQFLPTLAAIDLAFIDCEKEDYPRFFDMLPMRSGGVVVADNIISHSMNSYVDHVRALGMESITLCIGKGLEITRIAKVTAHEIANQLSHAREQP